MPNTVKCPRCGNEVPQGSLFCNKCGAPLTGQMECPKCHALIPADSIFCPHCHEMVGRQQGGPDAWTQGQQTAEGQDQDGDAGSHRTRNTVIVVLVLAFIAIVVIRNCFFSDNQGNILTGTGDQTEAAMTDDKSKDIFNSTLLSHNMKGDGDRIAYAMNVGNAEGTGGSNTIVGVTFNNNDPQKSYYKLYTLTRNGSDWDIKLSDTRYFVNRQLELDPGVMRAEEVPSIDQINEKYYFYFAYMTLPPSNREGEGTVTLVYYDIATGQLATSLEYAGEVAFGSDGQRQIIARNQPGTTGFLKERLAQHAASIGYLHVPTPEELAAEKAEQEKAAEEAAARAAADSMATASALDEAVQDQVGAERKENPTMHDKTQPMFRNEDFSKKITGPGYVVFLTKDGKVYAFNKNTDKNFVVYSAGDATDIGFEDSGRGIINIRTTRGRIQYDLPNTTSRRVE